MNLNRLLGLEEEDDINNLPPVPLRNDYVPNPVVNDYLMKKRKPAVESKQPMLEQEVQQIEAPQVDIKAQEEDSGSGLGWAQFAAGLGDAFAGRSPSQSAALFEDIRKRRKGEALDKSVRDPNSKQSIAFRRSIEANFPQVAKMYGPDWANISAADQELVFKPLQLKEQMDARKEAARLLSGQRKEMSDYRAQERQDRLDQKMEERDLSLAVPGYERTGEVLPKVEEAQKFRKATAVADQLATKLNRMKELVKQKGSFEYGGSEGTEMESLATEIQLLGKSPELYELGVLAGPDLTLLQKITADPASLNSFFTRNSSRIKQIDSQLKSVGEKLSSTAKSLGYKPKNQGLSPVNSGPQPGEEDGGYIFKGGDPSKPENWEKK